MAKRAIGICPACGERTAVTRIACDGCDTVIEGRFSLCEFCGLSLAQKEFLLAFLRSRGSIKDVEKSLGVSYPTVKNRLEDLLAALGLADRGGDARVGEPLGILRGLDEGEISFEQALDALKARRRQP